MIRHSLRVLGLLLMILPAQHIALAQAVGPQINCSSFSGATCTAWTFGQLTGVAAESFGASPSASATTNTAAIQSAINLAGKVTLSTCGTYQISSTLVLPQGGDIWFDVAPCVQIEMVTGGAGIPVLTNWAYTNRSSATSVTLSWSSGPTFTFTQSSPTYTVGEWVWLSGSSDTVAQNVYNGIFQIASVAGTTYTVTAIRTPTAAPSGGSPVAMPADTKIILTGGTWNYNYPANSQPSNNLNMHCIILGAAQNVTIKTVNSINAFKYAGELGAVRDVYVEGWHSDITNSDLFKVYGPAYNVKFVSADGQTGDDGVSFSSNETSTFSAYVWTGGGDIDLVSTDHVSITSSASGVGAVAFYPGPNEYNGNFVATNSSCIVPNNGACVKVGAAYPSATGIAQSIKIDGVGGTNGTTGAGHLIQIEGGTSGEILQINSLEMAHVTMDPAMVSGNVIEEGSTVTILSQSLHDCSATAATWSTSTVNFFMETGAVMYETRVDNCSMQGVGGDGRFYNLTGTNSFGHMAFSRITKTNGNDLLTYDSGNTNTAYIDFDGIDVSGGSGGAVADVRSPTRVTVRDSTLSAVTNGVIRVTGTIVVNYLLWGNTNLSSTVNEVTVSGSPTLTSIVCDNAGNCTNSTNVAAASLTDQDGSFGSSVTYSPKGCETGFGATTLSGSSTTTGQACLPAGALVDAIVYRITTTITTATSFTLGDSGSPTRYCGTQSTLTAGTTGVCTAQGYYVNGPTALGVLITPNAAPGAGAIRLIVYYHGFAAPSS